MTESALPVRVAALYRFATLPDCTALRDELAQLCRRETICGTLLLAPEGINGTIAGSDAGIDRVLARIRALPGCADPVVRNARAASPPFHRMKVRIKGEIVSMGEPDIDPAADAGHYVAPDQWNALIADPDTIVIDARNGYEVAVGSFAGAIDPGTSRFRDFPEWFRATRDQLVAGRASPKFAMFCTGGIRCEKATALLKREGLDEVYHLQGGILHYLQTIPAEDSLWQGECFVFDQRVAVAHGLAPGSYDLCHACRMPVGDEARASPLYRPGVSCPACHDRRDDAQRAGYAERERQTRIAAARGERHVGRVAISPTDRTDG